MSDSWGRLTRKVLRVLKFDNRAYAIDMLAYLDITLLMTPVERPDEEVDEPHRDLDILDGWRETQSLLHWIKYYRKPRETLLELE